MYLVGVFNICGIYFIGYCVFGLDEFYYYMNKGKMII